MTSIPATYLRILRRAADPTAIAAIHLQLLRSFK